MLVQSLTNYAENYLGKVLEDPSFERKKVQYVMYLSPDGKFMGDRDWEGKELPVPKSPVPKVAGIHPVIGCEACSYVLGPCIGQWTKPGEEDKHQRHHEGFIALHKEAEKDCPSPLLKAVNIFYADPEEFAKAKDYFISLKIKPGSRIALGVVDSKSNNESMFHLLIETQEIRQWWKDHYTQVFEKRVEKGGTGACLIDGKEGVIAPTADKIMGAGNLGGQSAGVSLMSFDKAAFRSYGWEQNANSPLCPEHTVAYVAALNDLMRYGQHRRGLASDRVVRTRFDAGSAAFLFWTRNPSDDDIVSLFHEAQPQEVERLLASVHTGAQYGVDTNDFYLLVVSGNGGRLLVRYWFHDKLENVRDNLSKWFEDIHIISVFNGGTMQKAPALKKILELLQPARKNANRSAKKNNVNDDVTNKRKTESPLNTERALFMVRRALHGLPMPRSILIAALNRLRHAEGSDRLNEIRVGLIRLCVNDIETVEKKGVPTMPEQLDEAMEHPAYVCGRLLAAYEALQYKAQGEVNVNVTDRYFSLASTKPQLAFPKLDTLSKAHLKKLRRDNAAAGYFLEKRIRDLIAKLGESFPAALNIEDQGRFVIGYHHQKAYDAQQAAEAKARKKASGEEE